MKSSIRLNGQEVAQSSIKFSAGEVQLVIPPTLIQSENFVEADIRCNDGMMLLLQLASVLEDVKSSLYLPYLPCSRYDRVEEAHDCLSVKVVAKLINSMGFARVTIEDCHSDVGIALLERAVNVEQHDLVQSLIPDLSTYDAIIAPDAGAMKKAGKLALKLGVPLVKCDKVRDFKTGKIVKFSAPVEELRPFAKVLIVDDICDGGGTFIGLTEVIHSIVPEVDLYVTHGIFSKGVEKLKEAGVNQLYAFNDWINSPLVISFNSEV